MRDGWLWVTVFRQFNRRNVRSLYVVLLPTPSVAAEGEIIPGALRVELTWFDPPHLRGARPRWPVLRVASDVGLIADRMAAQ